MTNAGEWPSKKDSIELLRAPANKNKQRGFFSRLFRRRKQQDEENDTLENVDTYSEGKHIQKEEYEEFTKEAHSENSHFGNDDDTSRVLKKNQKTPRCKMKKRQKSISSEDQRSIDDLLQDLRCKEFISENSYLSPSSKKLAIDIYNQAPKTPYKASISERLRDQSLGAYTESKNLELCPAYSIGIISEHHQETSKDVTKSKTRKGALKETSLLQDSPVIAFTRGCESDSDSACSGSSSDSEEPPPPPPARVVRQGTRNTPSICYSMKRTDISDEDRRRMNSYLNQFSSVHISRNLKDPIPKDPESLPGFHAKSRRQMAEALSKHGSSLFGRSQVSESGYEQKKDRCRSRLVVVIALLATTLVALGAAVAVLSFINLRGDDRNGRAQQLLAPGHCVSEDCIRSAARLLDSIDHSAEPCEDFYQFACGGWNKDNPVPESETTWDQFKHLREHLLTDIRALLEAPDGPTDIRPVKQARALYRACLNTDKMEEIGVAPMLKVMRRLGMGPDDDFDVVTTLGRAQRILGLNALLGFWVSQDMRNTTRNVMVMDQIAPGISERYLLQPERFPLELSEYSRYITDMVAVYREHDATLTEDDAVQLNDTEEFAQSVLEFSTELAKIMTPKEVRRDVRNLFHEMNIPHLQSLTDPKESPLLNFSKYLEIVFEDTNVTLDFETERIYILDINYLHKLALLLANTEPVTVERFIWWSVFSTLAPLTLQKFRDLSFRFSQRVFGLEQRTPRWKGCTGNVNTNFGMAVSYLYVQEHFNNQSRTKALEMVGDVRVAFAELVGELEWMDDHTKARTLEKAEAMRPFIGFPGWLLTPGQIDTYYKVQADVMEDQLFETYLSLSEVTVKKTLEELRAKPDHNRWVSPATTVNAFYSPILNSVTFPAGILQPPFYGLGLESLNYGAIGAIMGHELTHGFDDQGRRYDKDGNLKQWWTESTFEEYQQRVQCFIDQYGEFKILELGGNFTVNGINTQGENIADNGGLREALRAYRHFRARHSAEPELLLPGLSQYSPEQLFFLGFSNMWCGNSTPGALKSKVIEGVHSPNRYRVIGTLSNTKEFSEAWSCPKGSPMNPDKKCVLW